MKLARLLFMLLASAAVPAAAGGATQEPLANPLDPLRATLLESKEKNRGVIIHAKGGNISCIVVSVDEHYVVGRSNQASRVVIRMDRIDGVSAMF